MSDAADMNYLTEKATELLTYHKNSDVINLLWAGYFTSLNGIGCLDDEQLDQCLSLLKTSARDEAARFAETYPPYAEKLAQNTEFSLNDLGKNIQEHIASNGNSEAINLVWAGFLLAWSHEGLFMPDDYHDLNDQLKHTGSEELGHLSIGYPGQYE